MKKNDLYLKKGMSKKDLEIKKYKKRSKGLLLMLIILGAAFAINIGQNMISNISKDTSTKVVTNYLNDSNLTGKLTNVCPDPTLTSSISKGIFSFMDRLFSYPGGFWTKLFIFLGIIYLIQVMFSLVFDVIELALLVFVAIKRLIMWTYRKIFKKDKRDEQLKKIAEL